MINKFIIIVIVQGEKTKIEKEKGKKGINLGRNEQKNGESGCAELCMHAANPRPGLFPIIISLSVEISDNPTKRLDYFRFSGNPLQRFELREARIEKRENLRFSRPRLDYKLSENKQGQAYCFIATTLLRRDW